MHSVARAQVADAGAAVTFTKTLQQHDAATDAVTSTTLSVVGHAVQTRSDPKRYEALGLLITEARTLLFAPTIYGALPAPGYTVTWAGSEWTVRDVDPVAPDGTALVARVTVSR